MTEEDEYNIWIEKMRNFFRLENIKNKNKIRKLKIKNLYENME